MAFLLEASFYLFLALLIMPWLVLLAWAVRRIRAGLPELFLLLPSALLSLLVADMFWLGEPGCLPVWNTACDAITIVGWILYLPALIAQILFNGTAIAVLIERNRSTASQSKLKG